MSQLTDRLIPESEEAVATEMTEMLDRLLQVKDVRKKRGCYSQVRLLSQVLNQKLQAIMNFSWRGFYYSVQRDCD